VTNLNSLLISGDQYTEDQPLADNTTSSESGTTTAHFRDLDKHLISYIERYDVVVGCVAWFTHYEVLKALESKKGVSIIVQKEDFLRPEGGRNFNAKLRQLYDALPNKLTRWNKGLGRLQSMSYCGDAQIDSVRCVGNHNANKSPAFPRMHNKFLVFCNHEPGANWGDDATTPVAVWTGSFNISHNATCSFENAIFTTSPEIALAYFKEWQEIAALSEKLDWRTPWCEPQWRIGS
jgi:hypothetical protein